MAIGGIVKLNDFERLFTETLDDRRFSRAERRTLLTLLEEQRPPPEERLAMVGLAFELARVRLTRRGDRELLGWLEGLVRALFPLGLPTVGEAHFAPHQDCAGRLRELLDNTRQSAEICVFTITDNSLVRAILAAHERGVQVRILSDDEKSTDRGSDVERLRTAGIPLRLDRSSEDHMHHKFALFDRRILVNGSYNWTRGAAEGNWENIAVTDDRRLVRAFAAEFDRLWAEL